MDEPIIECPKCHHKIKLTETLAAAAVDARLKAERKKIEEEATKEARRKYGEELEAKSQELSNLTGRNKELNDKLGVAQKAQAKLIQKERELADKEREMELTIQTRVQASEDQIRDKAKRDAEQALDLKLAEKDKIISDTRKQLAEAQRKAEQGSQQLQGEIQEFELETLLRNKFQMDRIEEVPKGERGADALHNILDSAGEHCGSILRESKRTKAFGDSWLSKLREDQRRVKADVSILVSQALPKNVDSFAFIDGVWVTHWRYAIPVAIMLRNSIADISAARVSREGQQTKMEMIYDYLTGHAFRQRIEAIVEKIGDMQSDLDRERKAITRQWATREKQIEVIVEAMAGMYGDLKGIAGKTLAEIDGLGMRLLERPDADLNA